MIEKMIEKIKARVYARNVKQFPPETHIADLRKHSITWGTTSVGCSEGGSRGQNRYYDLYQR